MISITSDISIDDRELEERFVRASGPGGQNVNKVATAVELRFDVRGSSLPQGMKDRLEKIAGSRLSADGILLIDSREHRTQTKNREAARARLVGLLQQAAIKPRKRRPTKPGAGAREKRLESKKRRWTDQGAARRRERRVRAYQPQAIHSWRPPSGGSHARITLWKECAA